MEKILIELAHQQRFHIEDTSGVGEARRYAARLAEAQGFCETVAGELAIAVTEASTNILQHARGGEVLIRPLHGPGGNGIEVLALDRGPGISNLSDSMRDGVSTAGTPGSGLGAMYRLAAEFSVYSAPGKGTAVYMAFWVEAEFAAGDPAAGDPAADAFAPAQIGAVSLPMPGQDVCGDGWAVTGTRRMVCSVVDGLGHGPDAATAARASLDVLRDHAEVAPGRMLELAHQRTRPTRGAAVAFAVLERSEVAAPGHFEQVSASASRNLLFAGVGNIAASVVDGELRRQQLISHNGIVGHNLRKVQQVGARLDAGDLLVMHSDGLSSNWDLASYPGLSARHPALIAAVLYRDFNRGTDDVTILVVRCAA